MAFIDQGEFEAMKTPILVVELRIVISISFVLNDGEYLNRLRDIVVEHSGRNKNEKNGTFATAHFCV